MGPYTNRFSYTNAEGVDVTASPTRYAHRLLRPIVADTKYRNIRRAMCRFTSLCAEIQFGVRLADEKPDFYSRSTF